MKKILSFLLSLILILIGFRVVTIKTSKKVEENEYVRACKFEVVEEVETIVSIETEETQKYNSYAPIEYEISDFATSWYLQSTDGNITNEYDYLKNKIYIHHEGSNLESNMFFRDGIPCIKDMSYVLSFDASSTVDRKIRVAILNADNNEIIVSKDILLSVQDQNYSLEYTMDKDSIWNGRIVFYLGNDNIGVEHEININNILYEEQNDNSIAKVNQLGYHPSSSKRFVVPYNVGDYFMVKNVQTNEIVHIGPMIKEVVNDNTKEVNYYGDFTNLMSPGRYQIITQIAAKSYKFNIGDGAYHALFTDAFKFFSIQRCGMKLPSQLFDGFAHEECHKNVKNYDTKEVANITGGWHDAGDYGRYIQPGAKAVTDLMLAYMFNDKAFTDTMGIVESNNGISDVLDEVKYELNWMMQMQNSDGGVFSKTLTSNLPGDISPDEDAQDVYVLNVETTSTGDFVGVMALASKLYQSVDAEFADTCLEKALLSWEFLENNGTITKENPADINGGLYRDSKDSDERFFAAMSLYYVTGNSRYLDSAITVYNNDKDCANGVSYSDMGGYGKYLFLLMNDGSEFYNAMKQSLEDEANTLVGISEGDGYNTSTLVYNWGSNGDILNNGIILSMANEITGNKEYLKYAYEQINYLLGKNSLNMSFVTEYGEKYPTYPHHRITKARNLLLKGAVVGGVNSNREDPETMKLDNGVPNAKVYVNKYESYSTNEVAIYWNSSLLNLMTRLGLY